MCLSICVVRDGLCKCMSMPWHNHGDQKTNSSVSPYLPSCWRLSLFIVLLLLTNAQQSSPRASGNSLVSASHWPMGALQFQMLRLPISPLLCKGSGYLNSGPHTCMASTFTH